MKTADDLIRDTLLTLAVLGAGQPVPSEDADRVRRKIAPTLEELATSSRWDWTDATQFPDDGYLPLIDIMAVNCRADFGMNPATDAQRMDVLKRLTRVASVPPDYSTQAATYF
jgi:hypothetical protein